MKCSTMDSTQMSMSEGVNVATTLTARGYKDPLPVYMQNEDCNPMDNPLDPEIAEMKYVVRRLMPVECERLQGLPDGYTCVHFTEEMIDDKMLDDFIAIKLKWDVMNAKPNQAVKPKTRKQMKHWLLGISANPPDSPRYKACGNGWACNQPRWIVMNILNTFHPGWDDAPDAERDAASGINPQNGSLMFPCSHEVAHTLAVGHGGGYCNSESVIPCVDMGAGKSSCNETINLSPTLATTHQGSPVIATIGLNDE